MHWPSVHLNCDRYRLTAVQFALNVILYFQYLEMTIIIFMFLWLEIAMYILVYLCFIYIYVV